jgi:uncharacterized protein YdeI (YjbR/CyaY-like superfamily)
MTQPGLAKLDTAILGEEPPAKPLAKPRARGHVTPRIFKQAVQSSPKAWERFQNLAPSYRRRYVGWVMNAKKQETRERRLREVISLLEQNKKLGLK